MELEAWLEMADNRRAHSMDLTSKHFVKNILLTGDGAGSSSIATAGIPLRMPASIYSREKSAFVGLGWPKLATSLDSNTETSERSFLKVMLEELNSEFALQLDSEPVLDQVVHTLEVSTSHTVVFVGGSHASRLAEAARSTYPEVVDLSIGGWKLTKESAAEVALDLAGVLDDATDGSHTIVLHIFDNSIYKGKVGGELTDPVQINRKYHIEGKLVVMDHPEFKWLFETALPIFWSCTSSNIILLGPLPRYLLSKCCTEPSHVTNFGEKEYLAKLGNDIRDLGKLLRNLVHTRRLKRTKVLNPAVLMGVMDSAEAEPEKLLKLFGTDPVHLTEAGYIAMATRLAEELYTPQVVHMRSLSAGHLHQTSVPGGQRPIPRESWTAGTQVVAHRNANWIDRRGTRGSHLSPGSSTHRGAQRGRGGRRGRWPGKRGGYKPY